MNKFILILLFPLCSFAGVTSIGNGGGFAEMKAYDLYQQIPRLTQICLSSQYCDESFKVLLQKPKSIIHIRSTCTGSLLNKEGLDSCLLYKEDGNPKSTEELFRIVLDLRKLELGASLETNILTLFFQHSLSENNSTFVLWENSLLEKLHFENLSINQSLFSQNIYLETRKKTFNITSDITHALDCPKTFKNIELNQMSIIEQSQKSVVLSMTVNYLCGSQKISQKLYLQSELSQDETLINTIRVFDGY